MRGRGGASTLVVVGTVITVVLVTSVIAYVVVISGRSAGGQPVQAVTTIYISATCTNSTATTKGGSTTTYVSSFIGNLTVVTMTSQFSSTVITICR